MNHLFYQLTNEQKHAVAKRVLEAQDEAAIVVLLTQRATMERRIDDAKITIDDLISNGEEL